MLLRARCEAGKGGAGWRSCRRKTQMGRSGCECGGRRCSMSAVCFTRSPTLTAACPSCAGMSRNNHWFDPRNEYGGRGSEYGGGERGGAGRDGNGGGGYNGGGGGPGQYVSTRVTLQVGVGRSEPDPRMQHDGSGSERCGGRGGGRARHRHSGVCVAVTDLECGEVRGRRLVAACVRTRACVRGYLCVCAWVCRTGASGTNY